MNTAALRRPLFGSLCCCLLLSVSCSRIPAVLRVMEANVLSAGGMYTEAIEAYLKALEYEEAAPYAGYGLGSVYYSLDEGAAALGRFADSQKILDTLPPAAHRELRYRISYNTGVVLFGGGDFAGAAAAFREALRLDPGRLEAKRNLELSLLSLTRETGGRAEPRREESTGRAALFEYLRHKEQNRWQSREWEGEEQHHAPDY